MPKEWQIECQTMSKECRVFPKFPRWTSSSMSQGFSTQRFARRSAWFSCLVLAAPLNDFEANHFKTLFGVHVRHFLGGYWNPDHAKEPCFFSWICCSHHWSVKSWQDTTGPSSRKCRMKHCVKIPLGFLTNWFLHGAQQPNEPLFFIFICSRQALTIQRKSRPSISSEENRKNWTTACTWWFRIGHERCRTWFRRLGDTHAQTTSVPVKPQTLAFFPHFDTSIDTWNVTLTTEQP